MFVVHQVRVDGCHGHACEAMPIGQLHAHGKRGHGTRTLVSWAVVSLFVLWMGGCGSPTTEESATTASEPLEPSSRRAAAGSSGRALAFWERFNLDELVEFQETGRRPERLWLEKWGPPLEKKEDEDLWQATLEAALSEALARAERAAHAEPPPEAQTGEGPPAATIEAVSGAPAAWYDREVRFENVLVRGPIVASAEHGFLLAVTSPAGKSYPATPAGQRLVFSTYADAAKPLKAALAGGLPVRGTLYCRIVKGRQMLLGGLVVFPKAVIYRVELYPDGPP